MQCTFCAMNVAFLRRADVCAARQPLVPLTEEISNACPDPNGEVHAAPMADAKDKSRASCCEGPAGTHCGRTPDTDGDWLWRWRRRQHGTFSELGLLVDIGHGF